MNEKAMRNKNYARSLSTLRSQGAGGALIKLESLGAAGGRFLCVFQVIVFSVALWLIASSSYLSDRTVSLSTQLSTCGHYYPVVPPNALSDAKPLVSSCR